MEKKNNESTSFLSLDLNPYNPMDDAIEIIHGPVGDQDGADDNEAYSQESIDMYYYRLEADKT